MKRTRQTNKRLAIDADLSNQEMSLLYDPDLYNRISQLLEKKLSKQTDNFNNQISQLTSLLKEGENRLADKINSAVKEVETRLLNEINKKFCELKEDINDINERVSKLETATNEIIDLKKEIKQIKIQSLKHSNSLVACDLRINSVPFSSGENLVEMFDTICKTVQIPTPKLQSIHRLQNKNNKNKVNSPDGVIIAKLMTPHDKNFVLKAVNKYRKDNNNLKLTLLGFEPDARNLDFFVHENLTNGNFKILREALNFKRQKLLHSAYSYRGLVYIRQSQEDQPICIESLDALNNVFL